MFGRSTGCFCVLCEVLFGRSGLCGKIGIRLRARLKPDAWSEAYSKPQTTMTDDHFMRLALAEAQIALDENEVPVGAVIVYRNEVLSVAHNRREQWQNPTAHAEMIAMSQAAAKLGSWRLEECTLYVTLEPCPMCAGAIVQARIPVVVFGTADPKSGAVASLYQLLGDSRLNHRCEVRSGVLAEPCAEILRDFFRRQRLLGKK